MIIHSQTGVLQIAKQKLLQLYLCALSHEQPYILVNRKAVQISQKFIYIIPFFLSR